MTSPARILNIIIAAGCFAATGCKLELADAETTRSRLGFIKIAMVSRAVSGTGTFDISGVVRGFSARDTSLEVTGKGNFSHFIEIADTSGERHRVFYTVPGNHRVPVDTGMHITFSYRETPATPKRTGLIIKTRSDSLVCMIGNLTLDELIAEQNRLGIRTVSINSSNTPYLTRNTECGREGDYETVFASVSGSFTLPPARSGFLASDVTTYLIANVSNTQIIKNLSTCSTYSGEFSFFVIRR